MLNYIINIKYENDFHYYEYRHSVSRKLCYFNRLKLHYQSMNINESSLTEY